MRHFILSIAAAICCSSCVKKAPAPVSPEPVVADVPSAAEPEVPEVVAEVPDRVQVERVEFSDLPGWSGDTHGDALGAFRRSCARLARKGDGRSMGRSPIGGRVADWRAACRAAASVAVGDHQASRAFFEKQFVPYLVSNNGEAEGRFTGYYESSLRGSRARKGPYKTPLYKRPKELVMVDLRLFTEKPARRRIAGKVVGGKLKPFASRKEIVDGALKGRGLELVWVDDPIDAFFVQIQGSGRVELDNGKVMRIGYAGQNGHVYTAIGRTLIAEGALTRETVSMQSIREWLEANPDRAEAMMNENKSYVFFTEIRGEGPLGSQNVPLTSERSLAIDRTFIPQSAPIWLDTTAPLEGGEGGERPLRQLVIAQDSGGAIRGPVRGDVYWGHGDRASDIAGHMKSRGRYFILLPAGLSVAGP